MLGRNGPVIKSVYSPSPETGRESTLVEKISMRSSSFQSCMHMTENYLAVTTTLRNSALTTNFWLWQTRRNRIIMVALCNRADLIFLPCGFFLSIFFFFSSPNLSGHRLDVYHTSTHGVALVRIYNAGLKRAARGSLKMQDAKKSPKIAIWAPSHNFVGLYLRYKGTYRQSEKNC